MRPLRYSINVTLDGCCDHRAGVVDEDLHRHAVENLNQADALLFGRVTYEMMESAWRPPAPTGARPDWMEPFAQTINAAKKYVVSSTLEQVDWNAELVRGDLGKAVQQLKRESGKGLFVGGVKLPLALTELGLIDEYEFVVHPRLAGRGPTLFAGAIEACRLEAREPAGVRLGASGDAVRAEKVAIGLASPSQPHHRTIVMARGRAPDF
jgi:dihydrofolate reductase